MKANILTCPGKYWASMLVIIFTGPAVAASTSASATYVGDRPAVMTDTKALTGGPTGVSVGVGTTIPSTVGDVFMSAQASSSLGALGAAGSARSAGLAGSFQGYATAAWSDSFTFNADPSNVNTVGSFSGVIMVSGGLNFAFAGRAYADTQISATIDLFPGTGFNGGRTVVTGSARHYGGYDNGDVVINQPDFVLTYNNVPFTFGQPISLSVSLYVLAGISVIDTGSSARAEADYGHTLRWGGLTEVRNAEGNAISNYTALSDTSTFNYALPSPVPELGTIWLLGAGLLALALLQRLRRPNNRSS